MGLYNEQTNHSDSSGGYDRVMACWLGKAVGGTLGMPFEGYDGPHDLTFYRPVPTAMVPNDDLDLQVVWACFMDRLENVRVDRHVLAQAWLNHLDFPWDEYGVAIRNLKNGLRPPFTGAHDNWFVNGMGAAIRSEIWACLAPGNPELAAAYAYEDACVDHAGEGVYAEMYLASLESLAFVESDLNTLITTALSCIPPDCRVRCAVEDTYMWWYKHGNWRLVRDLIINRYGHENFTDVPMNLAFMVLGILDGGGDFSRSICTAVNCGRDTDCTGATVGAFMGILNPSGIPVRWLEPIGRNLVLSPGIRGIEAPATLDEFTSLVLDLRRRLDGRPCVAQADVEHAKHRGITSEMSFVRNMPNDESAPSLPEARSVVLPGTFGSMAGPDFGDEVLLLRYRFRIPDRRLVDIMFNSREETRVWVDGVYRFGRPGGTMAPSFHRVPQNQSCKLELEGSDHELIAAIRRPRNGADAEWVVGIGDGTTQQWLPASLLDD